MRSSDGGALTRLTTTPVGKHDYPGDFSPDGKRFVFKRSAEEQDGPLMIVDVTGGRPRPISTDGFEDPGRFSPDGASLLTSAGGTVMVVDLRGKILQRISRVGTFSFGPVWSPDGRWIAFSRAKTGPFADIFISRPDGADERQVTKTSANEIAVDWGAGEG